MKPNRAQAIFAALIGVVACTELSPVVPEQVEPVVQMSDNWLNDLRVASCPQGETFLASQPITIQTAPVELGDPNHFDKALGSDSLTYVGGWSLTSDDPGFGGLSGIEIFPNGNLLTVSDSGAFVWISMEDGEGFEPSGEGSIAYMRDADGRPLEGKSRADAEGLALKDGLALVSFERQHRVLSFDLEGCGAGARGMLVQDLAPMIAAAGFDISDNNGAEALALIGDVQLLVGIEKRGTYGAPLSIDEINHQPRINQYIDNGPRQSLTGADVLPDMNASSRDQTLYTVHRGYDPFRGNTIRIQETPLRWELRGDRPRNYVPDMSVLPHAYMVGSQRVLAELNPPLTVDNFEGIAATRLEDGTVRLYIISDNNFSDRQRTLLMAFDVVAE